MHIVLCILIVSYTILNKVLRLSPVSYLRGKFKAWGHIILGAKGAYFWVSRDYLIFNLANEMLLF